MFLERASLKVRSWGLACAEIPVSAGPVDVRLVALGDVRLKAVLDLAPASIFGEIWPLLKACDIRTCNLEGPLTSSQIPAGTIGSFVRTNPVAVGILEAAGLDVVNLANNHMLDYGQEGLLETVDLLGAVGIGACGLESREGLTRPVVRLVRGLRIGFMGFCDDYYPADDTETGPRPALISDDRVKKAIRSARRDVDILIVHLHWGYEFTLYPLLEYRDFARRMVEHGVDLVLCHHAHVNQGIEKWRHGAIVYGLGNAVFDQSQFIRAGHPWTNRSFLLEASLGRDGLRSLRLHPFGIASNGQIEALPGKGYDRLLVGIKRLSAHLRDEAFLLRNQQVITVVESVCLLTALREARQGGDGRLRERARQLILPRQQRLAARLHTFSAAVAGALLDISAAGDDLKQLRACYDRHCKTLDHAEETLRQHYDWRAAFRSRVPW